VAISSAVIIKAPMIRKPRGRFNIILGMITISILLFELPNFSRLIPKSFFVLSEAGSRKIDQFQADKDKKIEELNKNIKEYEEKIADLKRIINEQAARIRQQELDIQKLRTGGPLDPAKPPRCSQPIRLTPDGFEASEWAHAYPPSKAMDRNPKSKWGTRHGRPIGHFLKIIFREPKTITKIGIYNPDAEIMRVREATLRFSNDSQQSANFRGLNGWEHFEINPITTTSLVFEAVQIYPPSAKYMAIYEIELLGC
jgi:hypothetical protein